MTEDFRLEMSKAIKEVEETTFTKLYEENKKYVRPYQRIVLEAIKTFDFSSGEFIKESLENKVDLIGIPTSYSIYLVPEQRKARIRLRYLTDPRLKESKTYEKPDYLKNETFNEKYVDTLLAADGIEVRIDKADGIMSTSDHITIEFDASELIEVYNSAKDEIKKRERKI